MRSDNQTSFERERGVNDVRLEAEVAYLDITLPTDRRTPDKHLDIYKGLAENAYPMRLVKMHPEGISFAVERRHFKGVMELLTRLGYSFEAADEMVILAITAVNMREMWGVMAKMAETLLDADVEILQVGDAHDAVLCMVPQSEANLAHESLRKVFGLDGRPD